MTAAHALTWAGFVVTAALLVKGFPALLPQLREARAQLREARAYSRAVRARLTAPRPEPESLPGQRAIPASAREHAE